MADEKESEALLDRLRALAEERDNRDYRDKDTNLDNLRFVTSKLHSRILSQGKFNYRLPALVLAHPRKIPAKGYDFPSAEKFSLISLCLFFSI